MTIITKARVVSGQPQLDDMMMGLEVQTWDEALSQIPTEMLQEYYLRAVQAKTNSFALVPLDIIAAWNKAGEDARGPANVPKSMGDPEVAAKYAPGGKYGFLTQSRKGSKA